MLFSLSTLGLMAVSGGCSAQESREGARGHAGGDEFTGLRGEMVEHQIKGRGVKDERVLEAMRRVPRHEFVEAGLRDEAYEDRPLPIGHGQTISQPYIVAFMTEALELKPEHRMLEVGTGSGYQAAILAELCKEVYTIEIVKELATSAEATLKRLGYTNTQVRHGDGYKGWKEQAPFDRIIVTCAPSRVPQRLIDQLKEGGRLVIPVGEGYSQTLYLVTKEKGEAVQKAMLPVLFVPMTGEANQ